MYLLARLMCVFIVAVRHGRVVGIPTSDSHLGPDAATHRFLAAPTNGPGIAP